MQRMVIALLLISSQNAEFIRIKIDFQFLAHVHIRKLRIISANPIMPGPQLLDPFSIKRNSNWCVHHHNTFITRSETFVLYSNIQNAFFNYCKLHPSELFSQYLTPSI
jgi:hypothetical protein